MTMIAQVNDEDDKVNELAIRGYERKLQSLEAYHRRMEAEAREREAEITESMMPVVLGLGAIWLVGTLWKYRRR